MIPYPDLATPAACFSPFSCLEVLVNSVLRFSDFRNTFSLQKTRLFHEISLPRTAVPTVLLDPRCWTRFFDGNFSFFVLPLQPFCSCTFRIFAHAFWCEFGTFGSIFQHIFWILSPKTWCGLLLLAPRWRKRHVLQNVRKQEADFALQMQKQEASF